MRTLGNFLKKKKKSGKEQKDFSRKRGKKMRSGHVLHLNVFGCGCQASRAVYNFRQIVIKNVHYVYVCTNVKCEASLFKRPIHSI